jgi:hypothetical protein
MDPTLATGTLGAVPAMYDTSLDDSVGRPDVAELADEAGESWPMMGHVARLAAQMDDEEAWDAVICAGLIEP